MDGPRYGVLINDVDIVGKLVVSCSQVFILFGALKSYLFRHGWLSGLELDCSIQILVTGDFIAGVAAVTPDMKEACSAH